MPETDVLFLPWSTSAPAPMVISGAELDVRARTLPLILCDRVGSLQREQVAFFRLIMNLPNGEAWVMPAERWTRERIEELLENQEIECHYVVAGHLEIGIDARLQLEIFNLQGEFSVLQLDRRVPQEKIPAELSHLLHEIVEALHPDLPAAERDSMTVAATSNWEAFTAYLHGLDFLEAYVHHLPIKSIKAGLAWFLRALRADPDFSDGWMLVKSALSELISDTHAPLQPVQRALRELRALKPADGDLLALEAALFERAGKLRRAAQTWEAAMVNLPSGNREEAEFRAGVCQEERGDYKRALLHFDHILTIQAKHADALEHRAICLAHLDQLETAVEAWLSVLVLDPERPAVYGNLGRAFLLRGENARAEEYFKVGMTTQAPFWNVYHNYAELLLQQERWEELEKVAHQNLQRIPHDATGYYYRAMARHRLGRQAAATTDAVWVLDLEEERSELYKAAAKVLQWTCDEPLEKLYRRARRQCLKGSAAQGIRLLKKIMRRAPLSWGCWLHLGIAYSRRSASRKAIQAFQRALRCYPEQPEVRYELGLEYLHTHRYKKAKEQFTKACELEPANADFQCMLAMAHVHLREFDQAWACIRTARRLAPRHPMTHQIDRMIRRFHQK